MASEFDGYMADANEHIKTVFGVTATYTAPGGRPVSITAIPGPVRGETADDQQGETEINLCDIQVPVADVAAPEPGGIVTIEGEDWKVIQPPDIESGMSMLECRQDTPKSRHHETHKRKID